MATTTVTAIAALLFVRRPGKSASSRSTSGCPTPWPDPVSALIHAATMVTAGVYLMIRINPMLAASSDWLPVADRHPSAPPPPCCSRGHHRHRPERHQKVLAYSTVSQLGYMFMAIGTGAYIAAGFHMITHAFFQG